MSLKMRKVKNTLKNPEKLKTLIYFLDVCDFCLFHTVCFLEKESQGLFDSSFSLKCSVTH